MTFEEVILKLLVKTEKLQGEGRGSSVKKKRAERGKTDPPGRPRGEDSFRFLPCLHGLHSITRSPGQREEPRPGSPLPRRRSPPLPPSPGSPVLRGAVLRDEFALSHRDLSAVEMGPPHCPNLLPHRDPWGTPARMRPARAVSGAFI